MSTTQKSFINEIPLTMETVTASTFEYILWSNYHLWNSFFKSTFLFASHVNISISSRYFPLLVPFSNEMKWRRIVSNKNQGKRAEHIPIEVALNRASDYLKRAVLWLKLLKGTCNKRISRNVAGFLGVQLTIYFLCSFIF